MTDIKALLKTMVEKNASDLHLRVGCPPVVRINGMLLRGRMDSLTADDMNRMVQELLTEEQKKRFAEERELDIGIGLPSIGRFRVNAFNQRGTPSLAVRSIKTEIPRFESLNLPEVILDIAMKRRGLILVTGTTGSGKSTLLASMVDHINESGSRNIVTIEDPIEYLHRDKMSVIAQREIGSDTRDFPTALRASFRQDPDVILIGEIRDAETMETALSAADTGHLVMSTLHTMNAVETITRIVSFFPPHQHEQIRLVLAGTLVAVVSLRLLPRKDEAGMVPAAEIMVNNATTKEYLMDPAKLHSIQDIIVDGYTQYGSQSFDQSLFRLYQQDLISYETAKQYASNPDDLELRVSGIAGTSDRGWGDG
ncbi:MAG: PilT/PilU family type 4a pilus ATPase [Chitinivibrionales bacterium]|nr:PilT/PilU family type 4a pilus ATPase [Chitinivibrionales bacterium]MBD3358196.1 PilT/PilU family type 4a pilus ATPase [Chitinivibrionales bacterium]